MTSWTARTDHQIVPFGDNIMRLYDDEGETIVTARRTKLEAPWTISSSGADNTTADTRAEAIEAMKTRALETAPETFIVTAVPFGLAETP